MADVRGGGWSLYIDTNPLRVSAKCIPHERAPSAGCLPGDGRADRCCDRDQPYPCILSNRFARRASLVSTRLYSLHSFPFSGLLVIGETSITHTSGSEFKSLATPFTLFRAYEEIDATRYLLGDSLGGLYAGALARAFGACAFSL